MTAALALRAAQCSSEGGGDDPSINVPPRKDGVDAGDVEDASVEATIDANVPDTGPCDPKKPFGAPTRLPEFDAGAHQATPRLSHDELTIYFTTSGQGSELAKAARGSPTAPFGAPSIMAESSPSNDNDPSVSFDHLMLFFHSNRGGNPDLYMAKRNKTIDPWGTPTAIAPLATDAGEAHAYFRQAAGELWFVRDEGATAYDIFVAKQNGASFGPAQKVNELSSPVNDWQPQITEDGLTLVFASDRPGGKGKFDLWIARRTSTTLPFATPTPIDELNSIEDDYTGWLSDDGCRIWFSTDRNTAGANSQIFYAERPR